MNLKMKGLSSSSAAALNCKGAQAGFSAYLDGAMTGVEMAAMSAHMEFCSDCAVEFALWRNVQQVLGDMGPAVPPPRLQSTLRAAIAVERERGSNLSTLQRSVRAWNNTLAPLALRGCGGLAAALLLAGGLGWLFGAPIAASDDRMTHLVAPHYLYSQVPPRPIDSRDDLSSSAPIVVEALVDTNGRVYSYSIISGPEGFNGMGAHGKTDAQVKLQVEDNLLASVFQPATVFGVPVRGHVLLTYTGVSVRG